MSNHNLILNPSINLNNQPFSKNKTNSLIKITIIKYKIAHHPIYS